MKKLVVSLIGLVAASTPLIVAAQVTLTNPLGETDPRIIIARVIQGALSVSGSIALLMFIYGGVLWLTSAGKSEQVTKGKNILIWAVLGIVVIAGAYVAVAAIFNAVLAGNVNG
ncbi:hypothetical protein CO057_02280 [Candidatus Uhrbacteria bacterium CG_4_9_14_0_2_um_filter_41_50]|uniref:Conjugal transfer protein TrbC n=1 Tax=Candidatus Uhrbacteria bacterium CG_4_9_14_0_2_um_filter_41_50 TaxID=1975031 RepID=A0A2M8EPD9_9BACT|nr:MAG: hypothetical protein COZ45_03080 [Candidatus Uhrbacteria bacterium CG_4_10_14_3_um_filter_41_21]PIZ55453.1 MAG: hypothetical protein COY24_00285 [Candidatus Uhrbacteria bacterium CG_4_10_14_0_2_um_filter_41_21]PJB84634.1 MAG: hypothetical protein CO086_02640 [Candidatus Uhrbacteria bacterium CG_4_9_14_0_8_um_filter_41_16]PJC24537.1 MAG: hypothetical protein CO057_02280 [Candidatus Uhrbacteria bacterium CG_4_9_14_0_2_um_filter_41_50]PJE75386.1 MAG: hypothetical protein COV03_00430 [Candi